MFLEYTYKVFNSVIPPHVCEEIIKLGLSSGVKTGVTADKDSNNLSKEDLLNLQKIYQFALVLLRRSSYLY